MIGKLPNLLVALSTARYALVIVGGLLLDMTIALTLARFFSFPLPAAAVVGFAAGLVFNYVMFEFWAFARQETRLSLARFCASVAAALVAISVRVGVIWAISRLLGDTLPAQVLALGCGLAASLATNLTLTVLIFRRNRS